MKNENKRLTTSSLMKKKKQGEKIVMVTAYDYPGAAMMEEAGADVLLVGDSLAMVVQGRDTTLSVTLDQMIYHAEMVVRATRHPMVVVDMPFPYCQLGPDDAVRAAARIFQETGAGAVKIEAGVHRAETVRAVVDAGIPVMGHCGLMPQNVRQLGGFRIERNSEHLGHDIDALIDAGCFSILLECTSADAVSHVMERCPVPVIGIGAGNACDGQVLVFHDFLMYSTSDPSDLPRHVRPYACLHDVIVDAARKYAADVRSSQFPGPNESF